MLAGELLANLAFVCTEMTILGVILCFSGALGERVDRSFVPDIRGDVVLKHRPDPVSGAHIILDVPASGSLRR